MKNTFCIYVKKDDGSHNLHMKNLTSEQAIKQANEYYKIHGPGRSTILKES